MFQIMLSRNAGVGSVAEVADEESCRENVEWMQRERGTVLYGTNSGQVP